MTHDNCLDPDNNVHAIDCLSNPRYESPQCGCCWRTTDDDGNDLVIGTLHMPGRRAWRVCQECVNYMWHGRHPYEQERPDSEDQNI